MLKENVTEKSTDKTISYSLGNKRRIQINVSDDVAKTIRQTGNKAKWQRRNLLKRHHPEGYCEGISELAMREYYSADSTADEAERLYDIETVRIALDQLSDTQRRRLILYFWDCMNCAEIAELECVSKQSVHQSIKVALKKIKRILEKDLTFGIQNTNYSEGVNISSQK